MRQFLWYLFVWLNLTIGYAFATPSHEQLRDSAQDPAFTIHWAVNPAPPFHILSGPFKNLGICDVLIDKVAAALPQVNHPVNVMPHSRIAYSVTQSENLCFPCMIKREESPDFYYSDVTVVHPPLGIIVAAEKYPALGLGELQNVSERVSFAALASQSHLRFGKPAARQFPASLQGVVEKYDAQERFYELSGSEATIRVMRQIVLGRLDYTLEYPTVLRYYRLTHAQDNLVYIPTIELGNRPVPGAVGCTKNNWGKQAVEYIDQALKKVVNDPDYQSKQRFWQNLTE